MKKLTILTGAGISAESGIQTFRGENGLWDQEMVDEIANIHSWNKPEKKEKILDFHKQLYLKVKESFPNKGHLDLVRLEEMFEVMVVTQNVDDLHEKAGSKTIVHLHGEINKICNKHKNFITNVQSDDYIKVGDLHSDGTQMRPFVVWFYEDLGVGIDLKKMNNFILDSDILLVVGTSFNVYPAAGIINYFNNKKVYVIDPNKPELTNKNITFIEEQASTGVARFIEMVV